MDIAFGATVVHEIAVKVVKVQKSHRHISPLCPTAGSIEAALLTVACAEAQCTDTSCDECAIGIRLACLEAGRFGLE